MIKLTEKEKNILKDMTFIDLFSGIGGFRLAFESFGAKCVYSIDNDKYAAQTYKENFKTDSYGDIKKIDIKKIPSHDILCAGFPCQAFSISGKQLGFDDARGTLFFEILKITKELEPKILFLENVSNLEKHDKCRTFTLMKKTLEDLNYKIYHEILNAGDYAVPQSRKRIYIIAIRKDIDKHDFKFPEKIDEDVALEDILLDKNCEEFILKKKYHIDKEKIPDNRMNKPIRIGYVNKGGQGDRIYSDRGHAITLSASGGGNGSKTGLYYTNNVVRKLHPRETARLMGFPEDFKINKSIAQAHKQFGNSVVVDVLQYIIKELIKDGSVYNG